MDNIKNFIEHVMTPGHHSTVSAKTTEPAQTATHQSVANSNWLSNGSTYFPQQLPKSGGRVRTESESSIASDMSGISMNSSDLANRQIKRKDSEPYFWIM